MNKKKTVFSLVLVSVLVVGLIVFAGVFTKPGTAMPEQNPAKAALAALLAKEKELAPLMKRGDLTDEENLKLSQELFQLELDQAAYLETYGWDLYTGPVYHSVDIIRDSVKSSIETCQGIIDYADLHIPNTLSKRDYAIERAKTIASAEAKIHLLERFWAKLDSVDPKTADIKALSAEYEYRYALPGDIAYQNAYIEKAAAKAAAEFDRAEAAGAVSDGTAAAA